MSELFITVTDTYTAFTCKNIDPDKAAEEQALAQMEVDRDARLRDAQGRLAMARLALVDEYLESGEDGTADDYADEHPEPEAESQDGDEEEEPYEDPYEVIEYEMFDTVSR